jgi:hypothetical protein
MWVHNDSGGTLARNTICTWKSGSYGKAVGGNAGALTLNPAGVVDEFLVAATVADQLSFWLLVKGPCTLINSAGANFAVGDRIVTAVNGKVIEETAAPADTTAAMVQVNAFVGICEEASTVADDEFLAYFDPRVSYC